MMSESFENWWRCFEWCVRNAKKVWSCNKFKKMKCQCNRWVLVRNPDTSKEIVQFVHEVRPVFSVTLSTLLHMLCGWNDDTMPSFDIFIFYFVSDFICYFSCIYWLFWAKWPWNWKSLQNELWKCRNLAWYHHFTHIACAKE